MGQKPLFTIITPSYRNEPLAEQCFDSVKKQTFTDFEYIVVCDGSPGVPLIKTDPKGRDWWRNDYQNQFLPEGVAGSQQLRYIFDRVFQDDSRVQLVEKDKNEDTGPAKNTALGMARGRYVVFLDCDDWLEDDYLEKAHAALSNRTDPGLILYGGVRTWDGEQFSTFKATQGFFLEPANSKTILVAPTMTITAVNYFWPLELLNKYNVRFTYKRQGEDTAFFWDAYFAHFQEHQSFRFQEVPGVQCNYRIFSEQMTGDRETQIKLFEHTTEYHQKKMKNFRNLSWRHWALARLFVWRYEWYQRRLQKPNLINLLGPKFLIAISIVLAKFK